MLLQSKIYELIKYYLNKIDFFLLYFKLKTFFPTYFSNLEGSPLF